MRSLLVGLVLVAGCKLFESTAAQAEGSYVADLAACTATAKAHHPDDNVAGRAESAQCEHDVDVKWGVK